MSRDGWMAERLRRDIVRLEKQQRELEDQIAEVRAAHRYLDRLEAEGVEITIVLPDAMTAAVVEAGGGE